MTWQGFRRKKVDRVKFLAIFECPVCGYDVLCEIGSLPEVLVVSHALGIDIEYGS